MEIKLGIIIGIGLSALLLVIFIILLVWQVKRHRMKAKQRRLYHKEVHVPKIISRHRHFLSYGPHDAEASVYEVDIFTRSPYGTQASIRANFFTIFSPEAGPVYRPRSASPSRSRSNIMDPSMYYPNHPQRSTVMMHNSADQLTIPATAYFSSPTSTVMSFVNFGTTSQHTNYAYNCDTFGNPLRVVSYDSGQMNLREWAERSTEEVAQPQITFRL